MKSRPRISPATANGYVDDDAPHWRGDTAERIVRRRRKSIREDEKAAKASKKTRARGSKRSRTKADPNDPQRRLKRLERNIKRRKTLAARQRLQKQIDELRRELGL